MKYIYVPLGVAAVVCGAFWAGGRIAREKCRANVAATDVATQQQIINKLGKINAETYDTATADIRRVLREKYSIAE